MVSDTTSLTIPENVLKNGKEKFEEYLVSEVELETRNKKRKSLFCL